MTHNLRRHLEWWSAVPTLNNGCLIYKSAETVYMHVDSSGYGGGAVLSDDETTETRGFWYRGDRELCNLWFILDTNDTSIRTRYIKTTLRRTSGLTALSRESYYDDLAFNLRHFNHLDNI
eukprot:jgi/Tetstr1/425144/TSEL_015606.t1